MDNSVCKNDHIYNLKMESLFDLSIHIPEDTSKLLIWCTNINDRHLDSILQNLSLLVSPEEKTKIEKLRIKEDRKRSLLSLLMQKEMIRHVFKCSEDDFEIKRTLENKPFVVVGEKYVSDSLKSWNYNVSHHGQFVAIASLSNRLIGVDIVEISTHNPRYNSASNYVSMFESQLTSKELTNILSSSTDIAIYRQFAIYWSLKESFIKAIGKGLGFDLKQIEFEIHLVDSDETHQLRGSAMATIHGKQRKDWSFDFFCLDTNHLLTLARGPLNDVDMVWCDDEKKKLCDLQCNEIQRCQVVFKSVEELLFKEKKEDDDTFNTLYRQLDGLHL